MHFTVYGRSRSTVWILQAVSSDFFHVSPFGTVFLPTAYWLPDHVLSKKLFLSSLYSCFLYFSPDLFPVTVLFQQLYRIFILKNVYNSLTSKMAATIRKYTDVSVM